MNWIVIDKQMATPLFRQIYEQIATSILKGEFKAGTRLPSSRELAAQLGISRNVAVEAYDQLLAEGFVESRQGSGTRVAAGAYLEEAAEAPVIKDLAVSPERPSHVRGIDFRSGVPALDKFPLKQWGGYLSRVCAEARHDLLGYQEPGGRMELRQELVEYLRRTRRIRCLPQQVIITTGATQGLALVARLLYQPGTAAIVEDPLHKGMQQIFHLTGYSLAPVAVDALGIRTALLPGDPRVRCIYVTPSHQFPLGGVLPVQRRIELIRYAREHRCLVIEDDYDSEFRFEGPVLSALQTLEPDRVIYLGSFSKLLAPALRLGYVVLPEALVNQGLYLKKYSDVHTPVVEQLALARFITEGKLERYLLKLKRIYAARRQRLLEELAVYFEDRHTVWGAATGLHVTVEFPGVAFDEAILVKLAQSGVRVYPVEHHAIQKGHYRQRVIMGYGHLESETIAEGVRRLHRVIQEEQS